MKIRIMGTKPELLVAKQYYEELNNSPDISYVSISDFYPNRGNDKLYRLYIDIEYKSELNTLKRIE